MAAPRFTIPFRYSAVFLTCFAIWFVAGMKGGPGFSSYILGPIVEPVLLLTILFLPFTLLTIVFCAQTHRALPSRRSYALLCLGLLVMVALLWRLVLRDGPHDTVKGLAILSNFIAPVVIVLGVVAIIAEWRSRFPSILPASTRQNLPE